MNVKPLQPKSRNRFAPLLLILAALLFAASSFAQEQEGLSVSGSGTVYGTPDQASFQAGVSIADTDVTAAAAEANAVTQRILEALTEAGVEQRDVRTTNFSVRREDRWSQEGEPLEPLYRVMNTVNVTVRDVDRVGELLGVTLENGANYVNSVSFTHSDPASLERQARELAVADAHERATQLADLAGVTLGSPTFISEQPAVGPPMPLQASRVAYAEAMDSSVPVATGELGLTVSVYITYAIAPASQ